MSDHNTMTKDPSLLAVVPLAFLPEDRLANLLQTCRAETIRSGQIVIRPGSRFTHLLVPLDKGLREVHGEVEADPGEEIPAYRGVGLDSLLAGGTAPYSVIAAQETPAYFIPWDRLEPLIQDTPGLADYLRLVSESAAVQDIDIILDEMGCSPRFRAALLGALQAETLPPGTWVARQDDTPDFVFYGVLGTLQAYGQVDATSRPLWVVPKLTWQLWEHCLEKRPLRHGLKTLSKVELFKLPRRTVEGLRQDSPGDFAIFERLATVTANAEPEKADELPGVDQLEDLFPPPPRPARTFRFGYPFIQQRDETDCGAACMAMVSKFHGNDLSVQFWRDRIQTSREGTSFFDMATASEKIGFVSHGFELRDIRHVEPGLFPLIALRQGHFLVVYAVKKGEVIVGDPATGIRRIPRKEFKRGFNGYVLMLKPTEQFYQEKAPPPRYGHYLEAIKGNGTEMGLIFATSFGLTVLSMVPAFLSQFIIDTVLGRRDTQLLALLVVAAVVVGALVAMMAWLRQYYLAFLSSRFDFRMTSAFMRKLYSLPYDFFATRHVGDFTRRLSELERVRSFLTRRFIGTILNFMNLVVYGVALFLYSTVVAALVYLTAPLLTLLAVLFSRYLRRYYNESFAARSEQDSLLADQVRGVATIKALGAEVAARWRFEEALVRTLRNRYRFQITAGTLRALSGFLNQLISVAIIGLAAYLAIQGEMTPGQVVAVSILAAGVTRPFHSLARMWAELQEVWMVMDRLNDVFLAEPEQRPGQQALIKPRLRGEIEFQDVWFRYGGESNPWALKGVSFRILPGQRVALVGPSGAGKSTVALLAGRLYEPTQGTILVDGRDYREYDRQWLRQQIGLFLHETNLFRGTILENIAYGNPSPDMERVEAAAAMANATEFIQEKPNGYDYMITHGGLGLSAGQKQRLALARILYTDPAVLLLDEGTSAVDPRLERAILKAFEKDFQNRTVISILHRLPLLQFYDYFVVLENGQVARRGSHEELVGQGGYFAEVFSSDQ